MFNTSAPVLDSLVRAIHVHAGRAAVDGCGNGSVTARQVATVQLVARPPALWKTGEDFHRVFDRPTSTFRVR
jgi:hypothetical protein